MGSEMCIRDRQNTVVKLVEFDGEIAVVRPKDEFAGYGSAEDE